jgi:methylamine dehydrogenase heavy chain
MHDSASAVGRLALMGTLLWGLAGCAATPDAPAEAAAPKVAPLPGGLPAEPVGVNKELGPPSPHWVLYWVMEPAFEVSRQVLLDADVGEIRALVTTGIFPSLQASPDGRELIVTDTFNHGPSRLRKDYVSFYDASDYSLSEAIELPGRQRALFIPRAKSALIADGRMLVVYNWSPRSSITVIDTQERSILNEIETPGCFLAYPTGASGLSMLCGDGSLLTLHLDSAGQVTRRLMSEPFFDPDEDPIIENGPSIAGTWYFPSYGGEVYPVDLSGDEPVFGETWSLVDDYEEPEGAGRWLAGGLQLAAAHATRGELFFLVHPVAMSEGIGDHVFPGTEVWVYDVAQKKRTRRYVLENMATAVYVTPDDEPLMLVSAIAPEVFQQYGNVSPSILTIDVYDAVTGEHQRAFKDTGYALYFDTPPGSGGSR